MGYPMAMKSSSVCALEPKKKKNKVGPVIWDTLYIVRFGPVQVCQMSMIIWGQVSGDPPNTLASQRHLI